MVKVRVKRDKFVLLFESCLKIRSLEIEISTQVCVYQVEKLNQWKRNLVFLSIKFDARTYASVFGYDVFLFSFLCHFKLEVF